jgi:hypothetical protein
VVNSTGPLFFGTVAARAGRRFYLKNQRAGTRKASRVALQCLCGERPAQNLIRDRHNEMSIALEARYRLIRHAAGAEVHSNMHLLLRFAVTAFNCHHDIGFVGSVHPCPCARDSVRHFLSVAFSSAISHHLIRAHFSKVSIDGTVWPYSTRET